MPSAFEVVLCLEPSCTGLTVRDTTGFFSTTNPWAYNSPQASVPTLDTDGTFGYSQYVLSLFYAVQGGYQNTSNYLADPPVPDYTVNLLTWPHVVDSVTGVVTWEFTFEDLGITTGALRSGWWLARLDPVTWVNNSVTYDYSNDLTFAFTSEITSLMDAAMKKFYTEKGLGGKCSCGGTEIRELYQTYRIWRDLMPCVGLDNQFQATADYLYSKLPLCGC